MTCKDCIHNAVCYRKDTISSDYADKCGDYISDSLIDDIKAEIESMMKRIRPRFESMEVVVYTRGFNDGIGNALKIIDKHIGERSEA